MRNGASSGGTERYALLGAAWALMFAVSCGVDGRSMSFSIGTSSGATAATSAGDTGNPSGGALTQTGGTAGGGSGATESMAGQAPGGEGSGGEPEGGGSFGGSSSGSAGMTSSSGSGGGGTGGTGGSAGSAGTASGGEGGEPPFMSPCGDLNRNLVDDCDETLVQNSRFDADAQGWSAEPQLVQSWVTQDAMGKPGSGAVSLNNTFVNLLYGITISAGSYQCLNAWGKTTIDVAARAFIKSGQGTGGAVIELVGFAEQDCAGEMVGGSTVASAYKVDVWEVLRGKAKVPTAARSVRVRLTSEKPFSQPSFEVLFDDILVRKE